MPAVLTVDQRRSRRAQDRVPELLIVLEGRAGLLRPFERTAGDEVQGVLHDADQVVDLVLALTRSGHWSIGVGLGPVDEPLPASTRAGRGPAFSYARDAVDAAKRRPQHLAVAGPLAQACADVDAVLTLLAAVVQRRSPHGWQAADLMARGISVTEAARRLGVTRQAVGQRLSAGWWQQEQQARPAAARLVSRAWT
jgi:hypothetical protein